MNAHSSRYKSSPLSTTASLQPKLDQARAATKPAIAPTLEQVARATPNKNRAPFADPRASNLRTRTVALCQRAGSTHTHTSQARDLPRCQSCSRPSRDREFQHVVRLHHWAVFLPGSPRPLSNLWVWGLFEGQKKPSEAEISFGFIEGAQLQDPAESLNPIQATRACAASPRPSKKNI